MKITASKILLLLGYLSLETLAFTHLPPPLNSVVTRLSPFGVRQRRSALDHSHRGLTWDDKNELRNARLERERDLRQRFASGDELKGLRQDLEILRENLKWSEALGDTERVNDLKEAIAHGESRDPECVYSKTMQLIYSATSQEQPGLEPLIEMWTKEAALARSCLPRFNLEGLWVGNFEEQGYDMINVTYAGDTLVATKVTGDKNRGQVTFRANLAPVNETTGRGALEPIELVSEASRAKWGVNKLSRYAGQGRMATNHFAEGQLVMFAEDNFSFIWIPSRQHVFFGRPSPDVTLRMLRDIVAKEDELDNMRVHIATCFHMDAPPALVRQPKMDDPEPFRRIMLENELVGSMESDDSSSSHSFWNVQKWRNYIDDVLSEDK